MVKKGLSIFFLIAAICSSALAQQSPDTTTVNPNDTQQPDSNQLPKEFVLKPIVGLGVGMFTFYGDINNQKLVLPQTSRLGYELSISQNLNSFLNLRFYVLFGQLGANERSATDRNLNIQSEIRMGGLNISYNFDHILPKKRIIEPYFTLGFESFEYLSKTDLYDQNGNQYYYWSDGSIKNMAENDPNAANAIYLIRDYTYESDIRELNIDGFGKYPERSFAYTIGGGATMILHKQVTFRIGTAMHYTMTDFIDGVTENSTGLRKGDSKNDKFLMSSFSIHYEFKERKKKTGKDTTNFRDVDFFALDLEDKDGDGVKDFSDSCQGTPNGVAVDVKGCPLDGDNDLVPDYRDDEQNSAPNAFVDERGVTLSDSAIAMNYRIYIDSVGEFNDVIILPVVSAGGNYSTAPKMEYTVLLAKFTSGVPPDVMDKLLTIDDVTSTSLKDSSTAYTAGKFTKLSDAINYAMKMRAQGFADAKVVALRKNDIEEIKTNAFDGGNNNSSTNTNNNNSTNNNSTTNNNSNNNNTNNNNNNSSNTNNNSTNNNTNANNNTTTNNSNSNNNITSNNNSNNNNSNTNTNNSNNNSTNTSTDGLVFRVQVGAFKTKIPKGVFAQVPSLIEIKTENGLYKYVSGSYKNMDDALKHRKDLRLLGYDDAFVVAYKNGKRVSLNDLGLTNNTTTSNNEPSDKDFVNFKIQIGVFKGTPPDDKKDLISKVPNLTTETMPDGSTKYVAGNYKNYEQAQAAKKEIVSTYGITDAFIQAYFKGNPISIQEALDILKQ
jgi:hypothetical protein